LAQSDEPRAIEDLSLTEKLFYTQTWYPHLLPVHLFIGDCFKRVQLGYFSIFLINSFI